MSYTDYLHYHGTSYVANRLVCIFCGWPRAGLRYPSLPYTNLRQLMDHFSRTHGAVV